MVILGICLQTRITYRLSQSMSFYIKKEKDNILKLIILIN